MAVTVAGYINIYKSGVYHTPGKPGAYDRHAGELYPSWGEAWNARDEGAGYIATVGPVIWVEPCPIHPNPRTP